MLCELQEKTDTCAGHASWELKKPKAPVRTDQTIQLLAPSVSGLKLLPA
jgi:hypothetical protein